MHNALVCHIYITGHLLSTKMYMRKGRELMQSLIFTGGETVQRVTAPHQENHPLANTSRPDKTVIQATIAEAGSLYDAALEALFRVTFLYTFMLLMDHEAFYMEDSQLKDTTINGLWNLPQNWQDPLDGQGTFPGSPKSHKSFLPSHLRMMLNDVRSEEYLVDTDHKT